MAGTGPAMTIRGTAARGKSAIMVRGELAMTIWGTTVRGKLATAVRGKPTLTVELATTVRRKTGGG
jgi:hypothetical protein